jgi:hypothetical protein
MIFWNIFTEAEKMAFVLLAFMESNHTNSKVGSVESRCSDVAV